MLGPRAGDNAVISGSQYTWSSRMIQLSAGPLLKARDAVRLDPLATELALCVGGQPQIHALGRPSRAPAVPGSRSLGESWAGTPALLTVLQVTEAEVQGSPVLSPGWREFRKFLAELGKRDRGGLGVRLTQSSGEIRGSPGS